MDGVTAYLRVDDYQLLNKETRTISEPAFVLWRLNIDLLFKLFS
jgi:hypothetical protein